MFGQLLKFFQGYLYLILNAIYNTISILSVKKTLKHKYKQIKITLKKYLIFFLKK